MAKFKVDAGTLDLADKAAAALKGWVPTSESTTFWLTANPFGESFEHLGSMSIRSSSSSSHIKAHSGSDGGSAGTAWPTTRNTLVDAGVIDADACPAMSVATPPGGEHRLQGRPRRT
jgi:hypothetical protein